MSSESERALIGDTLPMWNKHDLRLHLEDLGVSSGMTLLVHSSLRAFGYVIGGVETVIEVLLEAVGTQGTLVMPAFSAQLSDPGDWQDPPMPTKWLEKVRLSMPPFDSTRTATWGVGSIPEQFRSWTGVLRSNHPIDSFCAYGKNAAAIVEGHSLDFALGNNSPLARVYELNGFILLLGVGHDVNTSLHFAELRSGIRALVTIGARVQVNLNPTWIKYQDCDYDSSEFCKVGEAFEACTNITRCALVGTAHAKLIPQRQLVNFAEEYFKI